MDLLFVGTALHVSQNLLNQGLHVRPPTLAIPGDPLVKFTPPHNDPAAHPVAGEGVGGIGEVASEGPHGEATIAREGLQGQVGEGPLR